MAWRRLTRIPRYGKGVMRKRCQVDFLDVTARRVARLHAQRIALPFLLVRTPDASRGPTTAGGRLLRWAYRPLTCVRGSDGILSGVRRSAARRTSSIRLFRACYRETPASRLGPSAVGWALPTISLRPNRRARRFAPRDLFTGCCDPAGWADPLKVTIPPRSGK